MDRASRFTRRQGLNLPGGEVEVTRGKPRLILASDFPIVAGADGALDLGEFVNPAYVALNQLTGSTRFPTDLEVTLTEVYPDGGERYVRRLEKVRELERAMHDDFETS